MDKNKIRFTALGLRGKRGKSLPLRMAGAFAVGEPGVDEGINGGKAEKVW
jgi:hypothetical protein